MSINKNIEMQFKEMSGSTAKNRLSIQTSYAIKLLVDFYELDDYVIFLDCIEDVAVKIIDSGEEKIYLYQIKTKKNGGFTLTHIIKEKWLEKLYKHKDTYDGSNYEISLVVNEFVGTKSSKIFANEKSNMETELLDHFVKNVKTDNLMMIKKAIASAEKIDEKHVDLTNFYFIKTHFHLDTHKEQAQRIISDFIEKIDPNAEVAKVRGLFKALYDTLDDRFNFELEPENTNYDEIERKKGFAKTEFKSAINAYASNSIPKSSELFMLLGVNTVACQRNMSVNRNQFLMDLCKKDASFKDFIIEVDSFLKTTTTELLLADGFDSLMENEKVSTIYKNEGYIKFAIAYRYKIIIDGGN